MFTRRWRLSTSSTKSDASDVHQAMEAIDQFNEISEPLAQVIMDGVVQSELGGKKVSEL